MIVMKFGGISLIDANSIERITEIVRGQLTLSPVVVVSAMGNTTKRLLEAAKALVKTDGRLTLDILSEIRAYHLREASLLFDEDFKKTAFLLVEGYFNELESLCSTTIAADEIPKCTLDAILSYGEIISSVIVAHTLNQRGIPACFLDSRDFIKTDDRFGAACPDQELTSQRIKAVVQPVVKDGIVPVIQGFIGSTLDGRTTTLGFGGSDYTATLVGSALDAIDIQIWKDVPGIMTSDPAVFGRAHIIKLCTFAEAAEITHSGAKVLHPKTIYPAAQKNIPIHVYNLKQPNARGTTICASAPPCALPIKSIAYKRPVTIISVSAPATGTTRLTIEEHWEEELLQVCANDQIVPLLSFTSDSGFAFAVDSDSMKTNCGKEILAMISKFGTVSAKSGKAIVSLVGQDLRDGMATVRKAIELIRRHSDVIIHDPSPIKVDLIINEMVVENVIADLHATLFSGFDPQFFESVL
jgi:aspartate kinase